MDLYKFITENYKENEPILLSDLKAEGMTKGAIRQQIKKLTDAGKIKRFDTGIYYMPKNSIFKSGSALSPEAVIEEKYLKENGELCGYITGPMVFNQIGLSTQVPMQFEVVTNKATTDYKETKLAKTKVIIRRPKIEVTPENYRVLQFMDVLKDIDLYAELEDAELKAKIKSYMNKMEITFSSLEPYFKYYPMKIYRNMYDAGVLHGTP